MASLTFGIDKLCPKCVSRNRKGARWGRGYLIKRDAQVTSDMTVLERLPMGMTKVECPKCKGEGVVR